MLFRSLAALRGPAPSGPVSGVFPAAADTFFAAERIRPGQGVVSAGPGFAVLVVLAGGGLLCSEQADDLPLSHGMTVLVPHGAGGTRIVGDCEVIRCIPPYGSHSNTAP